MASNLRMAKLLVETGAYRDLDKPVILTSGELGIYYINTEKLVQDGGEWEKFGDDSAGMISHAVRMMDQHPTFYEIIDLLTDSVARTMPQMPGEIRLVSGGQRRDWLFSGPIAYRLRVPHLSLYKEGMIQLNFSGEDAYKSHDSTFLINNAKVVHVVDLITEGSSVYRIEQGLPDGWVPMIRRAGGRITDLIAVVTRLQGGEENLARQGVNTHSFVAIDEDFLRTHSSNPERALAYQANPKAWSEAYLRENGALALIDTFNPQGGKLDRAIKFMERYDDTLHQAGRWNELDAEVRKRFGTQLK